MLERMRWSAASVAVAVALFGMVFQSSSVSAQSRPITIEDESLHRGAGSNPGEFSDLLFLLSVKGDDGKFYHIKAALYTTPKADRTNIVEIFEVTKPDIATGPSGNIANFSAPLYRPVPLMQPAGSIKASTSANETIYEMGPAKLISRPPNRFEWVNSDPKSEFDLVLELSGPPFWYGGGEKDFHSTPHSILNGFEAVGNVSGSITVNGKVVKVQGSGNYEHVWLGDYAKLEMGWYDWLWADSDQLYTVLFAVKPVGDKEMGVYLKKEKKYLWIKDKEFTVNHLEWSYVPEFQSFIPSKLQYVAKTEEGTLEMIGDVGLAYALAGGPPKERPAILHWHSVLYKIEGEFTYNNGRKVKLTNGFGEVEQQTWKEYPGRTIH